MDEKEHTTIRLGVSSCLLGNKVHFDGGHKHDRYITGTPGHYFNFVPVCPEVECGLSIPREAMRLIGDADSPQLVTNKTGIDLTDKMNDWTTSRVNLLTEEDLCGFIFKSTSPSSGMERVKVYDSNNVPLIVPITLMNQYVHKYNEQYLQKQYYLTPHPTELKLRNHA